MKSQNSDAALLEQALATIEMVLARADMEMHETPYEGPTMNAPLEIVNGARMSADQRFRASAAQTSINICLSAAAALVDISQAMMNRRIDRTPHDLEREWKALITHAKTASRSAYRAALLMSTHKNVLAAQGDAPPVLNDKTRVAFDALEFPEQESMAPRAGTRAAHGARSTAF